MFEKLTVGVLVKKDGLDIFESVFPSWYVLCSLSWLFVWLSAMPSVLAIFIFILFDRVIVAVRSLAPRFSVFRFVLQYSTVDKKTL
jgi:hypothetical protein